MNQDGQGDAIKNESLTEENAGKTKECVKCKEQISVDSKKCPHCKADQVSGKQVLIGCLSFVILVLILGSCLSTCGGGPQQPVDINAPKEKQFAQAKELYASAFIIAKKFVKGRLKSPATAKFAAMKENSVVWWKDNEFVCTIGVDAQNSFGAMLRSVFLVKVKYNGDDKWSLLEIQEVK